MIGSDTVALGQHLDRALEALDGGRGVENGVALRSAMSLGNRWMPLTRRAVRARSQLILSSRVGNRSRPGSTMTVCLGGSGSPENGGVPTGWKPRARAAASLGKASSSSDRHFSFAATTGGGELPRSIATYETGAHASRPDVDRFSGFRPCAFTAQSAALFVVSWSSVSADDAVSPSRGTGGDSPTCRAGRAWTAGHCRKLHERSGLPFWNLLECFQKDVSRHRDRKV